MTAEKWIPWLRKQGVQGLLAVHLAPLIHKEVATQLATRDAELAELRGKLSAYEDLAMLSEGKCVCEFLRMERDRSIST